jgi:hypothetical protein
MNITFTKEQISTVVGLIDLAVKSGGIQVAKQAIQIIDLFVAAQENDQSE